MTDDGPSFSQILEFVKQDGQQKTSEGTAPEKHNTS